MCLINSIIISWVLYYQNVSIFLVTLEVKFTTNKFPFNISRTSIIRNFMSSKIVTIKHDLDFLILSWGFSWTCIKRDFVHFISFHVINGLSYTIHIIGSKFNVLSSMRWSTPETVLQFNMFDCWSPIWNSSIWLCFPTETVICCFCSSDFSREGERKDQWKYKNLFHLILFNINYINHWFKKLNTLNFLI